VPPLPVMTFFVWRGSFLGGGGAIFFCFWAQVSPPRAFVPIREAFDPSGVPIGTLR
jgi:hypothetical protein